MWEIVKNIFSPTQYMPHGHCYLWQTPLVWLHVTGDFLIAIAYYSIPAMLIYFILKRRDIPFSGIFALFSTFIVLCGTGHLIDIWTLWHSAYWLSGIEKGVTGLVSCYTAGTLFGLIPQFLSLKSPQELEEINIKLQREIAVRENAELALRCAYEDLEIKVQERTAQLTETNTSLEREARDRQQAELKLRSVTERLQYLLATTPAVIFSCKLGGNYDVTFVSENIVSMMGYEARQFVDGSLDWHSLVHPEDREIIDTAFAQILQKELISYEYRELHKDGSYRWIHDEVKLVKDAAGIPVECVGYGVDITDRKQAEAALLQQLKRERLVNSIQERIRSSLNLEEVLTVAVEEVREFLSTDRTVIYRFNPDWSGFIAVESVAMGVMPIQGIDINDPCFRTDYVAVYEQGHIRAIDNIYTAAISECHINLLSQFQIKANLVVPILQGQNLWGLLIAHHCRSQKQWNSSEIESLKQISVQLAIAIQQCTLFEQAKTEIADRKLAEAALQKAVRVADAANVAKSEFLSSMSHELRTPLNAILGFSQVMVRDSSLNNEHQQHLGIINRAGEHLLSLINDILEMSKIEAGRIQLNESSFNLIRLLETLEEMFRLKAKSKRLQLKFEIAQNVPYFVNGDEGKLRQILINLVGNAIKFTETGSVTLRMKNKVEENLATENVELKNTERKAADRGCEKSAPAICDCAKANSIRPVSLHLQFEIQDTGPGIAAEEMNKLFLPFEQTKAGYKSEQGSGLGLPISRKFVQMMGGDIVVSSTPDFGSTFSFDIQLGLADATEIQMLKPHKKVIGLAPDQPEYRILVVDDRADNCLVIDRLLSPLGFLVREAKNGQEAIKVWEDWQPHLIWMDMQMPVMNGYEATRQIKSHPLGKETVIVALTASAFEEERKTILAAGCDDFMRKPFEAKILFAIIEKYLELRYIYDESVDNNLENESELSGVGSNESVGLQLAQMPSEWLDNIYDAAHECYDDKILRLIEGMPVEFAASAKVLTDLARDFLFDDIIELAKSAIKACDS
ncbi:response regulator [Tychonema sp. LEGE 07199]|uniref:ATP-binding protein n=1 Tax=unclassified Tychonema TaxID=2642144 RepID=UPI00187E4BA3|nr:MULTISPECIES: ATP-binding protein [unclassified Tychonema]MBE9123377.1 response regulator [Tychonema sp. LEGE 07199]MBE9130289.1 response regulator [Tychonema sp. LEGE 07196]